MIDPENHLALAAVIFALAWFGFWIDSRPIARVVPGVPWVIGIGLLLSNTGVIPREAAAFGFVGQYLLPMAVPLLLFKADLRQVISRGGWVLPAFMIASVGVCLGAVSGYYLFDLGQEGAKIAATYAGAFIGGVVNFVAISQAVEMTPTEFSVSLSASAPVSVLGLLVLVTLPALPWVQRWLGVARNQETVERSAITAQSKPSLRPSHLALALAMSLAICAVSTKLSARFGHQTYNLFYITVITVAVANVMPRRFARLEGDFELGMLCMYAFFAMIGAGTDAIGFLRSAPVLFVYCAYMLAIQFIVLLLGARLLRIDVPSMVVGSGAAIVGAGAAAAIASTKGWRALVTPAITIGMLGYVIANFIGIALYRWLAP